MLFPETCSIFEVYDYCWRFAGRKGQKWNGKTDERCTGVRNEAGKGLHLNALSFSTKLQLIAPCKGIQESLGIWIPRHGFRILDTGFWILCQWNLGHDPDSTKIQTGPTGKSGPPQKVDPVFRNFSSWTEPIHWVLDRNFRKFWLNGSRPWIPDYSRYEGSGFLELYSGFQDPGFQIPESSRHNGGTCETFPFCPVALWKVAGCKPTFQTGSFTDLCVRAKFWWRRPSA